MNAPTNVLAALMGKGLLNSMTTKNKGKTAIITIKYSVPDRAMLFSFYNYPNHFGYGLIRQVSTL